MATMLSYVSEEEEAGRRALSFVNESLEAPSVDVFVNVNVTFAVLKNIPDAFMSDFPSLEPGRMCMIMSYSQIASSRPKRMLDAPFAP